jgi:hypothetical protein
MIIDLSALNLADLLQTLILVILGIYSSRSNPTTTTRP